MPQDIGQLGEALVARWLCDQGWKILHQRWSCRWGEIDVIAQYSENLTAQTADSILSFVEVKTRQQRNWDADGLLAITPQKQRKLWKTAQLFLAVNPDLGDFTCRFDVALVQYQRSHPTIFPKIAAKLPLDSSKFNSETKIKIGQPVGVAGYQLTLQTYLEAAFIL